MMNFIYLFFILELKVRISIILYITVTKIIYHNKGVTHVTVPDIMII